MKIDNPYFIIFGSLIAGVSDSNLSSLASMYLTLILTIACIRAIKCDEAGLTSQDDREQKD